MSHSHWRGPQGGVFSHEETMLWLLLVRRGHVVVAVAQRVGLALPVVADGRCCSMKSRSLQELCVSCMSRLDALRSLSVQRGHFVFARSPNFRISPLFWVGEAGGVHSDARQGPGPGGTSWGSGLTPARASSRVQAGPDGAGQLGRYREASGSLLCPCSSHRRSAN